MNPYLSITVRTFTIWIMAAVINGLLCGIYLGISGQENGAIISLMFEVCFFSLIFAIPGFFIFWIFLLIMISRKIYGRSLFRSALSAGIILSSVTVLLSNKIIQKQSELAISVFIILSAITSVMLHFNLFKRLGTTK